MRISLTKAARVPAHPQQSSITPQPRPMASLPTMVAALPAVRSRKAAKRSSSPSQPRLMAPLSIRVQRSAGGFGGATVFDDSSTAGNGIFTNNGATASGAEGGVTEFGIFPSGNDDSPSAGNATIINNGAMTSGAVGGKTIFYETSTADSATLIANSGTGGGEGGQIFFNEKSTGGTSRVELFGNGSLDISAHAAPGVTIGSIEGDGIALLGDNNLTVGSNDLSTTFSGVIQDGGQNGGTGGSVTKIGSGTLVLSGANTYTGDTHINRGVLKIDGSINSNTFVHHTGTLAGTGTVHGNITNGGTVSPGDPVGTWTV